MSKDNRFGVPDGDTCGEELVSIAREYVVPPASPKTGVKKVGDRAEATSGSTSKSSSQSAKGQKNKKKSVKNKDDKKDS